MAAAVGVSAIVLVALVLSYSVKSNRPEEQDPTTPVQQALVPTPSLTIQTNTPTPLATMVDLEATSTATQPVSFSEYELKSLMFQLVNETRRAGRVQELVWDTTAEKVGQLHAQEMADLGYLSHWNIDGFAPDYRYTRAGGLNYVQENVFAYSQRRSDGTAAPISDLEAIVRSAHASLLASPGHRENILAPEHTHVGIGIAYNPVTGELRIVQEFVNQYAELAALPLRSALGQRVVMKGNLLAGSRNPVVNLAYEPFPEPLSLNQLNATQSFVSPAQFLEAVPVSMDATGTLVVEVTPVGAPGLYHVRLWVDGEAGIQIPSADFVVEVR